MGPQKTVYELLQAQAADPQVSRLLRQLDALSARCSLLGAGVAAGAAQGDPSGRAPAPPRHQQQQQRQQQQQQQPGGGWVGGVELPCACEDERVPLPPFGWVPCSEHEALQAAVEAASQALHAEAARLAWRSWGMQAANAARVLDLAWWAAAAAFLPEDPASAPLQARVVAAMSRHYVSALMGRRGAAGDAYLRLWVAATARAAAALLAAAFPRSAAAGELGEGLEARLRRQLRLWCTGPLPGEPPGPADGPPSAADALQRLGEDEQLLLPLGIPDAAEEGAAHDIGAGGGSKCCSGEAAAEAGDVTGLRGADGGRWDSHRGPAKRQPATVGFANCRPGPLMERALGAARLPAHHLRAGRRKVEQACIKGGASGGGRGADGGVSALRPRCAGGSLRDPAMVRPSGGVGGADASGNIDGRSSGGTAATCSARAAECHAAAEAAAAAYEARSRRLCQEVVAARRGSQRERREIQGCAGLAMRLDRGLRRDLGSAIAGLSGGCSAAATAAAAAGAAAGATETDAACKAGRLRSNLEWRGVDWRCEHKYHPRGRSVELAAALMGGRGSSGGGGAAAGAGQGGESGVSGRPAQRGGVRTAKAARRVMEGLARDRGDGVGRR